MGYCYGTSPTTGRQLLACDGCGSIGSTRKRTCPYKVLQSTFRTRSDVRRPVPYCPAPAYCPACYAERKGAGALHPFCKDAAKQAEAEQDAIQAALDGGEYLVCSASGDWRDDVPTGYVAVTFWNKAMDEIEVYLPKADYDPRGKSKLSDYHPDSLIPHKGAFGRVRSSV